MRVPMTVTTTRGEIHDLLVDLEGDHDGAELDLALREALVLPAETQTWVGERRLDGELTVGTPPLVAGAYLQVRTAGNPPPAVTTAASTPLRLAVVGGPDAGSDLPVRHGRRTIGRASTCDLSLADPALSRTHLEVVTDVDGVTLRDLGSTNPSRLDGLPLPTEGGLLLPGATVSVGSHRLELRPATTRSLPASPRGDGTLDVSPVPRPGPERAATTVEFPAEPTPPRQRSVPWPMLLLPLPVAGGMAYLFGPRMLVFALLSPLMILGTYLSDRMGSRGDARRAHAEWARTTARARRRLDDALDRARQERWRDHPDPHETRRIAVLPGVRLWERRHEHGRTVILRLGVGDESGPVAVTRLGQERQRPLLREVPVTLDLDEHPVIGVFGEPGVVERHARWLVGQIVCLHPPGDVDVVVVGDPPWARGLHRAPHVRTLTSADLGSLQDQASVRSGSSRTIVLTDAPAVLRRDDAWRRLLTDGPELGIRAIITGGDGAELPHECRATIAVTSTRTTLRSEGRTALLTVDGVDDEWGEAVGRALAPLRDATPGRAGSLPTSISLPDLLPLPSGPDDQAARWRDAPPGLRALLGQGEDGPLAIDLVSDGPHALVGGTTGSGKSELLQTWISGLTTTYGPERLNLVLVDYKGGAAFASCAALPHTVGVLTDLDPDGARRALASLQAEVRRREALLADVGAVDIDAYVAGGGRLPRLLLVVDEFRVLAQEQPEILGGIVRLAAVGRSLGLHLILATQRPAGIITPDIKANVNLRIALRVRDRGDSEDIIGTPDAALVPEGVPGRALVRTSGSAPTHFQAGYVGGRTLNESHLALLTEDGHPLGPRTAPACSAATSGETDLDVITTTASRAWKATADAPLHRPWLPPLPTTLADEDLPHPQDDLVVWGLTDHPDEQRRGTLTWGLDDGHLLVVGGSRSGRSTALASVLSRVGRTWSGRAVAHLVAPPSPLVDGLRTSQVVRSWMDPADLAGVLRLLRRVQQDIGERRAAVRGSGAPGYEAWWQSWRRGELDAPPPVLVIGLDGWGQLSRGEDRGRAEVAEIVESLARDGASVGVRLVVTGGRELLSGRLPSLAGRRLLLRMPDRGDLLAAGARADSIPATAEPGRGLVLPDQALAQVAQPLTTPVAARDVGSPWDWTITQLPKDVDLRDLKPSADGSIVIGHSGESGRPAVVALDEGGVWTVVGPPRSGRTTALTTVAAQLLDQGRPVVEVRRDGRAPIVDAAVRVEADDAAGLVAAVQQHEDLVVVADDIDDLTDTACVEVLRSLVRHCGRSRDVLLASTTTSAAASVRGLAPLVCRSRSGLLLQPHGRADGDPLGVRVSPVERVTGRGYLVERGEARAVQVAQVLADYGR